MKPSTGKFPLGQLVSTRGVFDWAEEQGMQSAIMNCVARHVSGDWGDVCVEDWASNDDAVKHGGRLLSAYTLAGTKIWIITEWDRSVTTVLFPDEY